MPMTIQEAAAAMRAGTLTSTALTRAHLDRIEALNPTLGAFITVMPEVALAEAAAADALFARGVDHGPLQGIPLAVKDIIATKTAPTTANSVVLDCCWITRTCRSVRRIAKPSSTPWTSTATRSTGRRSMAASSCASP